MKGGEACHQKKKHSGGKRFCVTAYDRGKKGSRFRNSSRPGRGRENPFAKGGRIEKVWLPAAYQGGEEKKRFSPP